MSQATDITVMTPLVIDLRGRTIVICGGGEVAARKARFFTAGECDVIVASRHISHHFDGMVIERRICDLSTMTEDQLQALVRGSFLVITATSDRTLNDHIGATCKEMGILCNNADGSIGDVIIPATIRGEAYLIAVTTFGKSPAFARYLRTYLERIGGEFDRMISLQERVRLYLKDRESVAEKRGQVLGEIINDPEVWNQLKEGEDSAWNLVQERYLHE